MLACPTLKERVFQSTRSRFNPPLVKAHASLSRPSKYKQWTDDRMSRAQYAVREDSSSIRRAAEEYNVPRSTLGYRISGRVKEGAVSGPLKYLSTAEEEELVRFLLECA